jgi:deoxyribonuclease-4
MAKNQRSLLLGAHMSIEGGFDQAIKRGESINCNTIQIFTKSNRQWQAKPITPEQAKSFKQAHQESSIGPIVAHGTYLINIGSSDKELSKKSMLAVIEELERCNELGIHYFVLHPGSSVNSTESECLQRISENLNLILSKTTSKTVLLLENMAGQGSVVCYKFEQLKTVYDQIEFKNRVGYCFDTCHAFAAGYDFRTLATYEKMWQEFDQILGIDNLKAIHINDSKKELGSRVDRHEEIGKGQLGLETFSLLFNDERFYDIPKILETPNDDLIDYAHNMTILKGLISTKTKKLLGISIKEES